MNFKVLKFELDNNSTLLTMKVWVFYWENVKKHIHCLDQEVNLY